MPASLRDVRVVSHAVNLPGLQFRRPPPSGTRSARPARMLTGLPRELVGTAIFLASDASALVTGHVVMCDDGYLAV